MTSPIRHILQGPGRANPQLLVHLGALAMVALAVVLTWALWPVMDRNPLLFFLVAVAISAWYGGLGPGLTATAGAVAALYAILLEPEHGLLLDGYNASRLGLFAFACVLLGWFSERRRSAERARNQVDQTFAGLFESASEAIVIVDEQGRIVRVNPAAERMFGYERSELLGQRIELLVPPEARQRHVHHRSRYVAEPRNRPMGRDMELRAVRKDGSEFPVEISLSYVEDNATARVMTLVTDISERKKAEASLEHYQERLRQLAFESLRAEHRERRRIAVDLHDRIGQTLALCQIKLGTLRERVDDAGAGDLDDCVGLVQQSIEDTRTLTFELSPPVLYDLGFGAAMLWLADHMRETHNLEVRVEGDETDVPTMEEELASLVFRSVRELLINAVKHAQAREAGVRMRRSGETFEIEVWDAGVGFDAEAVSRRDSPGARFGLFSIREQMERMGGEINVDSAPGRGTRVRLGVPIGEAARADGAGAAEHALGQRSVGL